MEHWEGKGGKSVVSILRFLCGTPLPMSVKDRGVGTREQVLNVPIACWWNGPSKPSSLTLTEDGFTPTTSMAGSGEKLGMNSQIGQPSCYILCWEPFFSGAVALFIIVDDFTKGCYVLTMWDTYGLEWYADWAWDVCGVLVRFSPAGCILIRIAAILGYE
jgi:hypothetical protein